MPGGTALFGSAAARGQTKNLVEFKAGKMMLKEKMVHPDKRKGLIYIYQSDDSLMHFCWKDRSNGSVEDDLIIFPDDVEFKRVPQCTTGRVYMLKFKSSSRKFFFWIQESKTDKDDDNCRKVNEILNNPPALGSQRSGGATPDGDLQNLLSNMSQQQLMQLFGGVGQIGGLSSLLGTMKSGNPDTAFCAKEVRKERIRYHPSYVSKVRELLASAKRLLENDELDEEKTIPNRDREVGKLLKAIDSALEARTTDNQNLQDFLQQGGREAVDALARILPKWHALRIQLREMEAENEAEKDDK